MANILFYLVIKPLSLLPLRLLYPLGHILYLFIDKIFGYRKSVVSENLRNSFPNKSELERRQIRRDFYRYISNLMVETVWMFSINEARIRSRFKIQNPELLNKFYKDGKDVIIILAHYSCWELVLSSLNLFVYHQVETIYVPLTNASFDKQYLKMRTSFGSKMIRKRDFKDSFSSNEAKPRAIIFGADQSPSISKNILWTNFLNQDTAVALGAEKYSIKYDIPVVYAHLSTTSRGYFNLEFSVIEDTPTSTSEGQITNLHVRKLEDQIINAPGYWLWSHRRWKKKRTNA